MKKSRKTKDPEKRFPIVGIGASAGGLDALNQLLKRLPNEHLGMAIVIIQHLAPDHTSMSVEILSRATTLPVIEAKNDMVLQTDHVYVLPPNFYLGLAGDCLRLFPRVAHSHRHLPIDFFLHSLAEEHKDLSLGVVLSGTGSDGTEGLLAIKAAGGVTFAQEPKSAEYEGMARSAISSGVVDFVLSPHAIADELVRISSQPVPVNGDEAVMSKIFAHLRSATQVDFSQYKRNTLMRRLSRRLLLLKIVDLEEYATYLEKHPEEINTLFADILIHVTRFFRDPKAFEVLRAQIIPKQMKGREPNTPLRIWVPGCSTGEEAYSIAISYLEFMDETAKQTPLQIFASDISDRAIQKARKGVYANITQEVSGDRLQKFFEKVDGGYRVSKRIRDACLFSKHDICNDPPFAKIDLVSCRNLFIYFAADLQKRIFPILHYALNPGGILWLGNSESVGAVANIFSSIDSTHKFFAKKNVKLSLQPGFSSMRFSPERLGPSRMASDSQGRLDIQRGLDRITALEYAPPSVVVNDAMEVLEVRGRTTPYLEVSSGQPSFNLLKMAHPGLIADIRQIVQSARERNGLAKKNGLRIQTDHGQKTLNLKVIPIELTPNSKERCFSIFFEDGSTVTPTADPVGEKQDTKTKKSRAHDSHVIDLQNQLSASQEYQQSLVEAYETAQEELTSSNEEMQSTNEELQSSNEEMETAKEELQSANEELTTVNDELQTRNTELTLATNDLANLLASVEIPIVMVGADGRIRRFTPRAGRALKLIPTDIGRPIGDLKPDIGVQNLDELVTEVMETLSIKELETQDREGIWYRLQVRPYRTADNKIDGAVIALINVDVLKRAAEELKISRDDASTIIEANPIPMLVVNSDRRVRLANQSFYEKFQVKRLETENVELSRLGEGQWNIPVLLQMVDKTLNDNIQFDGFEVNHSFPGIGPKNVVLSARKVQLAGSGMSTALIVIEDVTQRKDLANERLQLLAREKDARREAERANQVKDDFLAVLSHELRTPLTTILGWAQELSSTKEIPQAMIDGLSIIERSAQVQGQLINDLLDISRIQSGKLSIDVRVIDLAEVLKLAVGSARSPADKKSIAIDVDFPPSRCMIFADATRTQQVFWNLLNNAIKFTPSGGRVSVNLEIIGSTYERLAQVQVCDTGMGIKREFLPRIFERFSQEDSSLARRHGGLGLGLTLVKSLVEMQGGQVSAESDGEGKGAVFTVTIPMVPEENIPMRAASNLDHQHNLSIRLDGLRILIVDDDDLNRELFDAMVRSGGAEVQVARSAAEARAVLDKFKPDVLISDISMPGEDGYSLIRWVRQRDAEKDQYCPAIALTAYAGIDDVRRVIVAGFSAHVAKPVDKSILFKTILEVVKMNKG